MTEVRFLYVHSKSCEKGLLAPSCLSVFVSLTVRMKKLDSHWTDFHEISYLHVFRKSVEKIQVLLKYVRNNWCFTFRNMYSYNNASPHSY